jgi:hypothetical protein
VQHVCGGAGSVSPTQCRVLGVSGDVCPVPDIDGMQ